MLGRWEVVVANGPEFVVYAQAHVNPYSHRNLKKLDRLVKVLQCPCYGSPLAMRSELSLSCSSCSRLFPVRDFAAIMVLGEPEYPIDEAALSSPASNNLYPAPILRQLQEVISSGGLALDVGSGPEASASVS